jgi:predicted aspartyl protease
MIDGEVDADGIPIIELAVAGRDWDAIVDTGFNGDLELPESLRTHVKAHFKGRFHSLLAGNHLVLEDTFQVEFPFDGEIVTAEATFSPTVEILVGTHLLREHRLEIDFPAQLVCIQRVT